MAGTEMSAAMGGWSRRDTLAALVVATLLAVGLLAGVRPDGGGRPSAHPAPPRHPLPIRTIRVGASPSALALDSRTRRVFVVNQGTLDRSFVASGHGSVSVLDADTGTLLRTVPLGRQVYLGVPPAPRPLVVDERTGRVFLATSDVWPG